MGYGIICSTTVLCGGMKEKRTKPRIQVQLQVTSEQSNSSQQGKGTVLTNQLPTGVSLHWEF